MHSNPNINIQNERSLAQQGRIMKKVFFVGLFERGDDENKHNAKKSFLKVCFH